MNTINSEHYVANSIDTEHIDDLQITTTKLLMMQQLVERQLTMLLNSEHYTDGSIDTEHLADSLINTAKMLTML